MLIIRYWVWQFVARFSTIATLCLMTFILVAEAAKAQDYPSKPVRIVNPFAAGGPIDAIGRLVMQAMSTAFQQQIFIEHRPGASGTIGAESVAKARADGYSFLICGPAIFASAPHFYERIGYEPTKSFTAVALLTRNDYFAIVNAKVPATTLQELIALARARPGQLNFASAGKGHPMHIAGELFNTLAQVSIAHIPFKGANPAVTDVVAGHVQVVFTNAAPLLQHIKSGKIRALAVAASKRSPVLPEVPTSSELGLPEFEISTWFGLFAPAGTPPEVISLWNREVNRYLESSSGASALRAIGEEPAPMSTEAFREVVASNISSWAKVIRAANIRPE